MVQELFQKAMKFAGEKHYRQKVPGTDANYLLHIANVAMEVMIAHSVTNDFDLEYAVQVAILHDTLEDTDTTFEELNNIFGEKIAKGVEALTKNKSLPTKRERIIDSLNRINALEKEIGIVKLADRITNLQPPPQSWEIEKRKNYLEEAKLISRMLQNKNEYLENRLKEKIEEYKNYLAVN